MLDSLLNSQQFKPNQKPNQKSATNGGKDAKGRTTFGGGITQSKQPEKKPGESKVRKSSLVIKEERLDDDPQPTNQSSTSGAPSTSAAGAGSKAGGAAARGATSGGGASGTAGKGRAQRPGSKQKQEEKQKINIYELIGKLNPSKSVGMKLFLFFFTSIFLIVSVVGLFSFTTARDIIKQKVTFSSTQTIIQAAEKIDNQLGVFESLSTQMLLNQTLKRLCEELTGIHGVQGFVKKRQTLVNGIDLLNAYAAADRNIYQVDLFQRFGYRNAADSGASDTVMFKSVNDGGDINLSSQYFEDWLNRAHNANGDVVWFPSRPKGIMDIYYQPTFLLARVLKNGQNPKAEMILTMDISTKLFEKALEKVDLGKGGYTFVADADNSLMYDPDKAKLGKASPIAFNMNNKEPSGNYLTKGPDGQQVLVVYSNLKRAPWRVLGYFPVAELVKDANKIAVITVVMILIAIAIAIALGFIIARMIGRPLQELRNLMKQGEQGVLSIQTNFDTQDEIGQVGQSFNSMMKEISSLVDKTNISAQSVLDKSYDLSDASRQTASSVREISTSTEHISHGALDLAVEAEKVGQLTQNLSDQIQSVTNVNNELAGTAGEVQDASQRGVDQMEVLTFKTNQIEKITTSMIAKVDKLKESTDSIQKILSLLTNITKQTNILAINAGIEAARAGVHGKGFLVVANEVRKLADQSKESIKLVEGVTHLIQQEVEETVVVLKDAYPMFQEQILFVKEVDEIFKDVQSKMDLFIDQIESSTASIETLAGAQTVLADAVSSVSAISEESSATAEEVASLTQSQLVYTDGMVEISQSLENLSRGLRESLSRFKTD